MVTSSHISATTQRKSPVEIDSTPPILSNSEKVSPALRPPVHTSSKVTVGRLETGRRSNKSHTLARHSMIHGSATAQLHCSFHLECRPQTLERDSPSRLSMTVIQPCHATHPERRDADRRASSPQASQPEVTGLLYGHNTTTRRDQGRRDVSMARVSRARVVFG